MHFLIVPWGFPTLAGETRTLMNLHTKFAWVRAAGLVAALGLGGCDSGADTKADAKKVEPAKAAEPVNTPEPAKTEPTPDAKAADTAGAVTAGAADPADAADTKAGEAAGDAKAAETAPDAKATDKKTPAKTDVKKTEPKAPAIDGKPLYEAKCKSCHLADGKGSAAMKKKNVPDLSDAAWQGAHNKAKIAAAIADGIDGTPMKPFKDKLKPEEIDAIAAYVKKLK